MVTVLQARRLDTLAERPEFYLPAGALKISRSSSSQLCRVYMWGEIGNAKQNCGNCVLCSHSTFGFCKSERERERIGSGSHFQHEDPQLILEERVRLHGPYVHPIK